MLVRLPRSSVAVFQLLDNLGGQTAPFLLEMVNIILWPQFDEGLGFCFKLLVESAIEGFSDVFAHRFLPTCNNCPVSFEQVVFGVEFFVLGTC